MKNDKLHCSFCGKSQDAVAKLISSPQERPGTYICDECVWISVEILNGKSQQPTATHKRRKMIPLWLARMFGDRKPN
jgi:ATP-dependent protease Clp ATPase subunit